MTVTPKQLRDGAETPIHTLEDEMLIAELRAKIKQFAKALTLIRDLAISEYEYGYGTDVTTLRKIIQKANNALGE